MDRELQELVHRKFSESDILGAVEALETCLANEPGDRFKGLVGARFSNPLAVILADINAFITACQKNFDVKAVYLEMNGFEINYDRWYFDSFGYSEYGANPDDLEWLCDWQSEDWPQVTLTGLEAVQADFEWYHEDCVWEDKKYERAYDTAVLLVMAKFGALIQSALRSGERSKLIPVLATAHDFDIIARFAA